MLKNSKWQSKARTWLQEQHAKEKREDYNLHIDRFLDDAINKREHKLCFHLKLALPSRGLVTKSICRHLKKTQCLAFPWKDGERRGKGEKRGGKRGLTCHHYYCNSQFWILPFGELNRKKNHNAHKQMKFNVIRSTPIINIKNKLRAHLTLQKYLSLGPQHHNFPERWHQCWAWSICISLGQLAGCF